MLLVDRAAEAGPPRAGFLLRRLPPGTPGERPPACIGRCGSSDLPVN